MTTLDIVRDWLDQSRKQHGRLRQIAITSGVPYTTVSQIAHGKRPDPQFSTVMRLHADMLRRAQCGGSGEAPNGRAA